MTVTFVHRNMLNRNRVPLLSGASAKLRFDNAGSRSYHLYTNEFWPPFGARHCVIRYAKPQNLDEALTLLADGRWRILAGGTDFYPAQGNRPFRDNVLDINGLSELRGISQTAEHLVIGGRARWTDIVRHRFPPAFAALQLAAREVGSVQIQNAGTVAGNLCNASPAADGVPPLLILDADVEVASTAGKRQVPLGEFITGNRITDLRPGELLTAVRIPKAATVGASAFQKLGARRYLVISIAMAAARLVVGADGRIEGAAVAVGSCSAVAQRLRGLEARLVGATASDIGDAVAADLFTELSPIDDVRGSADYRREAAREIVRRALADAFAASGPARAAA
jgi:CO/xanthine dehydrogenase FAD-binding subunit